MKSAFSLPAEPSNSNLALSLPENYQQNSVFLSAESVVENPRHMRPEAAYDLALHLQQTSRLPLILDIGCLDPTMLTNRFSSDNIAIIGDNAVLNRMQGKISKKRQFLQSFNKLLYLPESILAKSIVICGDAIHRLQDPLPLIESLSNISKVAPFVIVSSPDRRRCDGDFHHGPPTTEGHLRNWSINELMNLFHRFGAKIPFYGHASPWTYRHRPQHTIFLMGTHCLTTPAPEKKVCALVSTYNDIDIIQQCYSHLKKEGVSVAFIDNWSEDGTWEKIRQWRTTEPDHCVRAERIPAHGPSPDFELASILSKKASLAHSLDFDWFINHDSDEFRQSPCPNLSLKEAISRIDSLGYSAIDHTVLDFRPIDNSFSPGSDPLKEIPYFEFGNRIDHFIQVRAWKKQINPINLLRLGGHRSFFSGAKTYPLKFLLRHYSIRSEQHARQKFFKHRLPRVKKEQAQYGWHTHLEKEIQSCQDHQFLWKEEDLIPFNKFTFFTEHLVQRITGQGIHEENRQKAIQISLALSHQ